MKGHAVRVMVMVISIGQEGNAHTISERPVNMRTTVRIMIRAKTDPMTVSGYDRNTVQMITGKRDKATL